MARLTTDEMEMLKKYRLSCEKATPQSSITGQALLKPDHVQKLLASSEIQLKLNTSNHKVIGSMIMKRYAFLAALVLYTMSVYNKGINSSLANLSLQTDEKDPIWLPSFYFDNLEVTSPGKSRNEWRTGVIESLFTYNIAKIVSAISKEAKITKNILWENTAIYIFWMYESIIEEGKYEDEKLDRIKEDFQFVVENAPAELFGCKDTNPLSKFYHPKKDDIRKRSTCCLFYLTSKNSDRCKTCPIECKQPANN
ncbi:ferric iron reductase protein FhuF [Metabacillus crassostreae]|uniref:IucA/IucC family C-terminal-domain containing protein n=1 Tax=Metabacillus crassostreae TaxID=929098 RepID=UPI0019574F02|nr:IucA/IucC family C-terminal-domain containing protein [Metabacillus crassostreae]MBM7605850.1 ferric iron reductase protein FhuF [Metabacillus crassostreae]